MDAHTHGLQMEDEWLPGSFSSLQEDELASLDAGLCVASRKHTQASQPGHCKLAAACRLHDAPWTHLL